MTLITFLSLATTALADGPWLVFDGADGPGKGKHIVLVSGDEEYRSEEALPQLAKILANAPWLQVHGALRHRPRTARSTPTATTTSPAWKPCKRPT